MNAAHSERVRKKRLLSLQNELAAVTQTIIRLEAAERLEPSVSLGVRIAAAVRRQSILEETIYRLNHNVNNANNRTRSCISSFTADS
jgi:DNA-binding XRE family transcriptional regulator